MKTSTAKPGRFFQRLHLGIFFLMCLLLVPTITIWRQSQTYIVMMSWVAMAYASVSSWQASRVEANQEEDK
jgi:hypothetical protein